MVTPQDNGYILGDKPIYEDHQIRRYATQDPTIYIEYHDLSAVLLDTDEEDKLEKYLEYYEGIRLKLMDKNLEAYIPEVIDSDIEGKWIAFGLPEGLYTLENVFFSFSKGMDGRDFAWIMNRILMVRNEVDAPATFSLKNVLVHPEGHGVMILGWHYYKDGAINRMAFELIELRSLMQRYLNDSPDSLEQVKFFQKFTDSVISEEYAGRNQTNYSHLIKEYKLKLQILYGPPRFRELKLDNNYSSSYLEDESRVIRESF